MHPCFPVFVLDPSLVPIEVRTLQVAALAIATDLIEQPPLVAYQDRQKQQWGSFVVGLRRAVLRSIQKNLRRCPLRKFLRWPLAAPLLSS